MSVADVAPAGPVEVRAVEALVERMCREFDVAADVVRGHALAISAEFADARVQAFVPVLVERRLRLVLRTLVRGTIPARCAAEASG